MNWKKRYFSPFFGYSILQVSDLISNWSCCKINWGFWVCVCCFVFRVKCHTHGTAILIENFPYEWKAVEKVNSILRNSNWTVWIRYNYDFFFHFFLQYSNGINIHCFNAINEMHFTKTTCMSLEKLYTSNLYRKK